MCMGVRESSPQLNSLGMFEIGLGQYSAGSIAPVGHTKAHAPQPMHTSERLAYGVETFRSGPRPSKQIVDTIEYNLEQLDNLSIEELEMLKQTTDSLIEHMERVKIKQAAEEKLTSN